MPTYPLPYRIKEFLRRQIAWSREVLEELEVFCAAPGDGDADALLAAQQRRERETRSMANEYEGLAHEWAEARDVSTEEEAEIRELSREAEALVEEVRAHYRLADAHAAKQRAANANALNDLRRGRRSVTIYRPGTLVSPGFVDRKA